MRPLSGEEESHLAGTAAAPVDGLGGQPKPARGCLGFHQFEGLFNLFNQVSCAAVVDCQAFRPANGGRGGHDVIGYMPGFNLFQGALQGGFQFSRGVRAQEQQAAVEGYGICFCGNGHADLCFLRLCGGVGVLFIGEQAGDMFFNHHVKIGAPKTKRADPGPADIAAGNLPGAQFGVYKKGRFRKIDLRVGFAEIERRRQFFLVQRITDFNQCRCTRSALQVADIGLDAAQCNAGCRQAQFAKNAVQALHFGHIPHLGRSAVAFHQAGCRRVQPCVFPGPFNRPLLAARVGRRDAFAFTVAARTGAANDRINLVAVFFGVCQAFEHQDAAAFAHHEPVGAGGIRPRAVRAECANFTEFDKRFGAHVAVHPACDHRVKLVVEKSLHRRLHRCQGRCAGRIGDKVRPVEIEHVGHPPGNDVGYLARHGVFGHFMRLIPDAFLHAVQQGLACGAGQQLEIRQR